MAADPGPRFAAVGPSAIIRGVKLTPDSLADHLAGTLAPAYLVFGDEPLQQMEVADALRARAREVGFSERELLEVQKGFDWDRLAAAASNLSLFGDRRLIEVRIEGSGPGRDGSAALQAFLADPPGDVLLLVLAPRLDAAARRSAWFRAIESVGVTVHTAVDSPAATARWLRRRLSARGLPPDPALADLLLHRAEGNLLAAAQEIDKLALLHEGERLTVEAAESAVGDSARFTVYDLGAAAFAGDAARAARVLMGLRAEGNEPIGVIGALAYELRVLQAAARERERGRSLEQAFGAARVWASKKGPYGAALRRWDARGLESLLAGCGHCDRVAKGRLPGRPWDELLDLVLRLAGRPLGLATVPGVAGEATAGRRGS